MKYSKHIFLILDMLEIKILICSFILQNNSVIEISLKLLYIFYYKKIITVKIIIIWYFLKYIFKTVYICMLYDVNAKYIHRYKNKF